MAALPAAIAFVSTSVPPISIPAVAQGPAAQGPAIEQQDSETQDPETQTAEEIAAIHGIYLPTDRQLTRGFRQARQRIEAGEYTEAVAFLQEVLTRNEDFFVSLPSPGKPNQGAELVGLKSEVRKLIAQFPAQGIAAYELQYAARAQKLLQQALQDTPGDGQKDGIASIVRTYFHTPAGREAALLLAQQRLDRGNPTGAASIYHDLLENRQAKQKLEPQLSLLYAAALTAAKRQSAASDVVQSIRLRGLTNDLVVAGKVVADKKLASTDRGGPGIASLAPDLVGELRGVPPEEDWKTFSGNPSRNAQRSGGRPHMWPRWRARIASHPRLESYLRTQQTTQNRAGHTAIPLSMPLAIGEVVVARTPTKVVAVNWKTGKLIWETRSMERDELDRLLASLAPVNINANSAIHGQIADHRVWHDSLDASLSSDGKRVYTIRNRQAAPSQRNLARRNLARGRLQMFGRHVVATQELTNRLAAYELASEGKLVWELDGRRATGDLAGAFFLGAPLAVDGAIYLLAELKSAIYLLALAPESGKLLWRQQLLSLERGVQLDANRSRLGAQPSFSGKLLVCPTSAGAIVAIDLLTRSLAWAHVYPREDPTLRMNQFFLRRQQQLRQNRTGQKGNNGRWSEGTPRIVDGRVLVTPRDSSQLRCLDLATGKLLWKQARRDCEFVGCANNDTVLLVAPHHVQAVRFADGQPAWDGKQQKLPDGVFPSGFGVLSEGVFHLPLSSGQLAAINVTSGDVQYQSPPTNPETAEPLGNLIVHRGAIVSQSPFSLDKFEQHSVFLNRTEAALAIDKQNVLARRNYGELALADGKYKLAAESLKAAWEMEPDDLITRELLTETLIHLLKTDFAAHQPDLQLAKELADDPVSQSELLRIEAEGLLDSRDYVATAKVLQRIGKDYVTTQPMWKSAPSQRVRSDRWTQRRMATLWQQATPDERIAIEQILAPKIELPGDSGLFQSLAKQQRWLAFFDGHPQSATVRIAIAKRLIEQHDFLPAEMVLLGLSHGLNHGLHREAMTLWEALEDQGAAAGQELPGFADSKSASWATQRVTSHVSSTPALNVNRRAVRRSGTFRTLQIEGVYAERTEATSSMRSDRFYIAPDITELRMRNDLGEDVLRVDLKGIQSTATARGQNLNTIYGVQLGSVLLVNFGLEVVAINTRGDDRTGAGNVLWQSSQLATDSTLSASGRFAPDRGPYYYTSPRRRLVNQQGEICCSLGPVTPRGVVFQDSQSLRCVAPLTGELLWSRAGLPEVCELFGDGQRVFAKSPTSSDIFVFDMIDGSSFGTVPLPQGKWLATAGSNLAVTHIDVNKQIHIRIYDLSTQDVALDVVLDEQYAAGTRILVLEPGTLAVMEPEGRFHFIDIPKARVLVNYNIPSSTPVVAHYVVHDKSRLFLFTQHSNTAPGNQYQPIVSGSSNHIVFSGSIHALDLKSGAPIWPVPATVRNQGLLLDQPADSPILTFVCRQVGRDSVGHNGIGHNRGKAKDALRMLCLDKASGRSVYRSDKRKKTPDGQVRILVEHGLVEHGAQPSVSIRTLAEEIRLSLTDEPISPEPPAQFVVEDHKEPSSSLMELGHKVGKELLDALGESNPFKREPMDEAPEPRASDPEEAGDKEAQP